MKDEDKVRWIVVLDWKDGLLWMNKVESLEEMS